MSTKLLHAIFIANFKYENKTACKIIWMITLPVIKLREKLNFEKDFKLKMIYVIIS